jgi:hypothetical protein
LASRHVLFLPFFFTNSSLALFRIITADDHQQRFRFRNGSQTAETKLWVAAMPERLVLLDIAKP